MLSGVAIMTDTDNTGESAEAYYGDIVFKKQGEPPDRLLPAVSPRVGDSAFRSGPSQRVTSH
jgi:hypothetical protein